MTSQAAVDDVPVKICRRHATLGFSIDNISVQFKKHAAMSIALDRLQAAVASNNMLALCFNAPTQILPAPARPVTSITVNVLCGEKLWSDMLDHAMALPCSIDVRAAPSMTTACGRSCLQFFADNRCVVIWSATSKCTVAHDINTAILQRTKGGMSTYDVHLLCNGSANVITIEMLPHSSMDEWEDHIGSGDVFDVGADPIAASSLEKMYPEFGSCWTSVVKAIKETDVDDDCSSDAASSESCYSSAQEDDMSESSSSSNGDDESSDGEPAEAEGGIDLFGSDPEVEESDEDASDSMCDSDAVDE